MISAVVWDKCNPCIEKNECKGPEARVCLQYLRNDKDVSVAGVEYLRGVGEEIREVKEGTRICKACGPLRGI